MTIVAGTVQTLKRRSRDINDKIIRDSTFSIENKLIEIDSRLLDIERRLKAGGL